MHELGPEPNFNESMYFNIFDPGGRLGGFFRLGNRANEGHAEMTVCIWLPDGRVAFMFQRPEIHSNDAFDAAGMRFNVIEPFEELHVTYDGPVVVLSNPLQMSDPRRAFTDNPHVSCKAELVYNGRSGMFGGEPDDQRERQGEEFARGHYEQLVEATGSLIVDDRRFDLHGYGLRDHSWGPRYWQAPWYYRWLTANFEEDFGFMGSRIARRDGEGIRTGFVWDRGVLNVCDDLRIKTTWRDEAHYHGDIEALLRSDRRTWCVRGRVLSLVPLRNRRHGPSGELLSTRISEGFTEWSLEDGRKGYGISEYLDQIVDGLPVGLGE